MSYFMILTILGITSLMFGALLLYVFYYHSEAYRDYEIKHEREKYLMEVSNDARISSK